MNQQVNNGGGFSFDLNQVEDVSGGVIPAGSYRAQVEKAELKTNKAGNGQYIECQFTVTDEKQNGRKFWDMFNINHPNQDAVKIGLGRIKSLITSSGGQAGMFTSPGQLVGLECVVTLKVTTDEYGEKNRITNFKNLPADLPQGYDVGGNPPF